MKKTKTSSTPAIAALLTSLACGCVVGADTGTSSSGSRGSCGDDTIDMYVLGHDQVVMLQESLEPDACLETCADLGTYADECSWSLQPGSGETEDPTEGGLGNTSVGPTTGAGSSGSADGTGGTGTASTSGGDTGTASTSGDDPEAASTSGGEPLAGTLTCVAYSHCIGGRGHAALEPAGEAASGDALGQWLAAMAHSEAASVVAFRAIADELEAHGAPAALVQRAREAAEDEVRHAEVMGTLARQRGVEPSRPRFSPIEIRDLEALALENAVEGCVRETWAALEACCQARRAQDPALRRAMTIIAEDESRHAQLSWDLDAWARTRLSAESVARLDAARDRAVEALERSIGASRGAMLHGAAGIPEPTTARHLLDQLRHALWC